MWVFSMQTSETAGWWYADASRAQRTASGVEHAVGVVDGMELHARSCGPPRRTRRPRRAGAPGDHGGSRRGQDPDGNLVGHGPRGDEERGRLADASANASSSARTVGILPVVVVAHLGVGHGAAHGRCRPGDRVTAQIDQVGHAITLTVAPVTSRRAPPAPDCTGRSPAVPERPARHPRAARRRGGRSRVPNGSCSACR